MRPYWARAPQRHRKRRVQKKIDAGGGAKHYLPRRFRTPFGQAPPGRFDFAILNKQNQVVCAPSKGAAALWFNWANQSGRRVVKKTWLGGDVEVSTVFLGIDHGFGIFGERWFETMVFGGPIDGETYRYATWEQAVKGHQIMVEAAEMEGHSTSWKMAMELTVMH